MPTLRFPDENPGWTLNLTVDGEDRTCPAQGEVTVPTDAELHLDTKGDLEPLRGVPTELLTGLTAAGLGAGQLEILKGFTALTTLFLQGDFCDADVELLAPEVLPGVTFLMISSSGVTGTCFSHLSAHPDLAVSVYGCPLSDEGFAALLQLPAKRTRTVGVGVLSAGMLEEVSEIAAEDLMLPVSDVAVPALVDLIGRSPRLTSFALVDEQDGTPVLDDETVRELRGRRPDLTIDGSWLAPDAMDRVAAGPALAAGPDVRPAEPVVVTAANFDELTSGSTPVLVDFMAQWCGPCKNLAPTVHEISAELAGRLVVGTLDIDEQKEIAERFGIMSIPALLVFRDGRHVARIGARDKQGMYAELAAVL